MHGQAVDIAEQLNNLIGFPAGTVLVLEERMPPALSSIRRKRRDAEATAKLPADLQAAKAATAKAELEGLHAEANYRVAHAKLMEVIGAN